VNKKRLIVKQLDTTLRRFESLRNVSAPPKGWLHAIRSALGMSARQLAVRVGFSQQALARIEHAEQNGAVTVKTLRRIAEQLDCVFVYGFVPRTSLESTVRQQAHRVAVKRLGKATQTMALEDQELDRQENRKILSDLVDELTDNPPSNLWDAP
jgi:predicted DNA-binding mobile mystery protein A